MATILLWKSLRPNIAPNKKFIEYILNLIGNEIPSLNQIALTSLCTMIINYLPLLHYKNVINHYIQIKIPLIGLINIMVKIK